jgi:hypothetical protein
MERANHYLAGNDAIAQWTSPVRATVFDREKAVAKVEHRQFMALYFHGATFTHRNVFALRYTYPAGFPAHCVTLSSS